MPKTLQMHGRRHQAAEDTVAYIYNEIYMVLSISREQNETGEIGSSTQFWVYKNQNNNYCIGF